MDREFYNSLTEAYAQVQESRDSRGSQLAAERLKREQEKQQNQTPRVIRGQGNRPVRPNPNGGITNRGGGVGGANSDPGRPNPPAPAVDPAPPAGGNPPAPAVQPASSQPAVQPAVQPARTPGQGQDPKISGYGPDGKPIRTSDVEARNDNTAAQAEMDRGTTGVVKAPTKPFVSRATGRTVKPMAATPRLDAATSGIGKWNEELFHDLCDYLYEKNMARSYAHAADMLGEMSPEFIRDLTQEL